MLCGHPPFYDDNPFGIYEKILAGNIDWPKHLVADARDIIKRLLVSFGTYAASRAPNQGTFRMISLRRHPMSHEGKFSVGVTSLRTGVAEKNRANNEKETTFTDVGRSESFLKKTHIISESLGYVCEGRRCDAE